MVVVEKGGGALDLIGKAGWLDDWQAALLLYFSDLLSNAAQMLHSLQGKTEHVSSSSLLVRLPAY